MESVIFTVCGLLQLIHVMLVRAEIHFERQRYDGWYNNLANLDWGTRGSEVISKVPSAFADMTYKPSGPNRPNPREISNMILSGPSGLPSYKSKNALFVFFAQMVAYEIVHASDPTCPAELLKIPVPKQDPHFTKNSSLGAPPESIPFVRSAYNKQTGQSPNNPRRPLNKVTSWIDASFVYGTGEVWANCLRTFKDGRLMAHDKTQRYPGLNKIRLPLDNYPSPIHHKLMTPESLWMSGDPHAHQNPGLLSIAVVWFRYHNYLAEQCKLKHPDWNDALIFNTARKWLIATIQSVIYYDWLPAFLGKDLKPYKGYQNHIHPGVSAIFEAAAFRVGHTSTPPGIYLRDFKCNFRNPGNGTALRLCNVYWHSQDILTKYGLEEIILGMTSQIAEREDHVIVTDLRGYSFGPLHFSRHDLATLSIMRGRDHGLPDYNTARKALGLPPIRTWEEINPWLAKTHPQVIKKLRRVYNDSLDDLDIYPAGLLESTPEGIGPLFMAAVVDQFTRLRDGDRFWFENSQNGLFTEKEIKELKGLTFRDILLKVMPNVTDADLPRNVFFWKKGDPCPQPKQLQEDDMEPCTPAQRFDYFQGSELYLLGSYGFFIVLPLVLILVIYLIAKLKARHYYHTQRALHMDQLTAMVREPSRVLTVMEWQGDHEFPRRVEIRLDKFRQASCKCFLVSTTGLMVRTIDFGRIKEVNIWLTSEYHRPTLMLHIPKEYDLVIWFDRESDREIFMSKLKRRLAKVSKDLHVKSTTWKDIQRRACTKKTRQKLLVKFFKTVFSEALNITELKPVNELEMTKCKEIANCELSREEFSEALALKSNSTFVNQMFTLLDTDGDGYISFREILYAVLLFSKGSPEEKLHMLFLMYDLNRSGTLSKEEMSNMMRSMLETASADLEEAEMTQLIDEMFTSSNLDGKASITFKEFSHIMSMHLPLLHNLDLDWKGAKQAGNKTLKKFQLSKLRVHPVVSPSENNTSLNPSLKPEGKDLVRDHEDKATPQSPEISQKSSPNGCTGGTSTHRGCNGSPPDMDKNSPGVNLANAVDRTPKNYTKLGDHLKTVTHYIENSRQHISYLIIFFAVCGAVFAERFYYYSVESEHTGLRAIAGPAVSVSRGGAAGMSFCFSFILLTMCRNIITKLRETFLNLYIPFDCTIQFHKIVAWTAFVFAVLHVGGYFFNIYSIATQPIQYLCILDELYFRSDALPKVTFWIFQTLPGFTGVLLVITIMVMFIFASQYARKHIFGSFWITHKLYYALYILILLHGSSHLLQDPDFPYYFLGPAILFTIDKMISMSVKKKAISVFRAELQSSDILCLEFKRPPNFEYKSGQWVRVACIAQGENEYHPFTLTSAPHEDTLMLHIRAVGPWTWNLRNNFDPEKLKDGPYPKLYIDGPYGSGQQDWYRYGVSVLVAGGIGVTPYASILKDFVHMTSIRNIFKIKCQKLYFIWVTASQKHFEWMIDILRQVEEVDTRNVVEIHIFITQFFQKFDLRSTMLYLCEEHFQKINNKSLFTGLRAKTHFGRPQFGKVLEAIHRQHPKEQNVGVFSCGPSGLTKGVQKGCGQASSHSRARFKHSFENF